VETADSHTFAGLRTSGWLLGAVPALTSGTFDSTTVALTDCAVQPLPLDKFREALSDVKVSRWINQVLAAEAKNEIARTAAAAGRVFPPVIEEVFIELMLVAGLPCADGSIRLSFPLTVTEVGTIVGASRECASRILSDLQSMGVVTHVDDRFSIPARSRLIERIRCRQRAPGVRQRDM
jgi:CRP-like cAMP-binding protein